MLLDFTAEWCAACKANETAFLDTDAVRAALARTGVVPMRADMTKPSAELDALLDALGRGGVPTYVIELPDGTRDLLPVAVTARLIVEHLDAAATRTDPGGLGSHRAW